MFVQYSVAFHSTDQYQPYSQTNPGVDTYSSLQHFNSISSPSALHSVLEWTFGDVHQHVKHNSPGFTNILLISKMFISLRAFMKDEDQKIMRIFPYIQ